MLNTQDYLCLTDRSWENVSRAAIRPAFFIPESVRADVLFRKMKQLRCQFAIVLDEYGGMEGVITISDLLAELVGDFNEEEEPDIVSIAPDTWQIHGSADLKDVEEALNVSFDEEECDTFGGLLLARNGYIPKDGTQFDIELAGLAIHVTEIRGHRIENTLVKRLPAKAPEPDQEN